MIRKTRGAYQGGRFERGGGHTNQRYPDIDAVEILGWGNYNDRERYWPITVRVVGTDHPDKWDTTLRNEKGTLGKIVEKNERFEEVLEFRASLDDYGRWKVNEMSMSRVDAKIDLDAMQPATVKEAWDKLKEKTMMIKEANGHFDKCLEHYDRFRGSSDQGVRKKEIYAAFDEVEKAKTLYNQALELPGDNDWFAERQNRCMEVYKELKMKKGQY